MSKSKRPLAVVTGASTGIGYELARCCAENDFDLIIAADEDEIENAAEHFRDMGANVEAVKADLATIEGVKTLYAATKGRQVDALLANAGIGLGQGFLDQDFNDVIRVIDTNITGTLYLIHRVGGDMRKKQAGRILITGSIAGYTPGTFHAVYHGTKAFIDSFSYALRNELKDSGVTVTCLMPGATETKFFDRAGLSDTKVGQASKDNPADVAEAGFKAMMDGESDLVFGWQNKLETTMANVTSAEKLAERTRKQYEPGSGKEQ
jgi:short-subunit dehydrogenase